MKKRAKGQHRDRSQSASELAQPQSATPGGSNTDRLAELRRMLPGAAFGEALALGSDRLRALGDAVNTDADRQGLAKLIELGPDSTQLDTLMNLEEAGLSDDERGQLQKLSDGGAEVDDLEAVGEMQAKGVPLDKVAEARKKGGEGRQSTLPHKSEMEHAFGEDFSGLTVRVGAAGLAGMGAHAAHSDEGVAFADTNPSKDDVSHELAHEVQGRRNGGGSAAVSTPGQAGEREAEQVASAVRSGRRPEVQERRPARVSRKPWYSHVGDFFVGAGEGLVDTVKGVGTLAWGTFKLTSPIVWLVAPEETAKTWNNLKNTVSAVADNPWLIWDTFKEPFVKDWNEGRPGAAIGRGVFEVISLIFGAKGLDKVAKGSKLAGVADDLGKIGGKLDEVGDVGKIGGKADELGDVGKVGDKADELGDVGKTTSKASHGVDVSKAGGKMDDFGKIKSKGDVPQHYRSDKRFDDLSNDPAHGKVTPTGLKEAMSGLEAEKAGVLKGPIKRGPKEIEFYDADGVPWDVKTPPSPGSGAKWKFNANKSGKSILKQLKKTAVNETTGNADKVRVLLDSTYMKPDDLKAVMQYLEKNATPEELSRVKQVNVKL